MKHHATQGVAIISVIMITAVILILVVTFSTVAVSERKSASTTTVVNETLLAADSLSERARMKIVEAYEGGEYSIGGFLDAIRKQKSGGTVTFPNIHGVKVDTTNGISGRWEIKSVSPAPSAGGSDQAGWIEVAATADQGANSQTVVRRIGFGDVDIFDLAMLTETVNCMFCHLRVNGDVGALKHLRPGWGTEGVNGIGSANANEGSRVNGSVFAAQTITNDDTVLTGPSRRINGAQVTGTIEANSTSSKLPRDRNGDGVPDFPPINRDIARNSAKGTVSSAAVMIGTPLTGTVTNVTTSTISSVNGVYNGNLILVGTAANPIDLSGDIFAEGDIIIKGVVKGIGGVYAGRNIYFAGDVTLQNPPDKPGTGVCASVTDPDLCARANITANKDALRTGARSNIVIGDYTEYNASNAKLPWTLRQSSTFYRSQFGFETGGTTRYFDKATGDELTLSGGRYYNVDGTEIASGNVKAIAPQTTPATNVSGDEAYDYAFRPGKINADGSFSTWLSDGKYRELLGTESYSYGNTRALNVDRSNTTAAANAFKNELRAAITQVGLTYSNTSIDNVWNNRNTSGSEIVINNSSNTPIGRAQWSGSELRLILTPETTTYETQVNQVEAFIYANQRIAGRTSMQAMAIEGGMIAKEIGVLAPGRDLWWPFEDDYPALPRNCDQPTVGGVANKYYVKGVGAGSCLLHLNYDHRLRNGGYGFNLVLGEIGKTISWRVAKSSSDKVGAP